MDELIKQAFHHVPLIEIQVQNGQYDLIGPDGEVILPKVWEKTIQPDWTITMQLWPMVDRYNTGSNAVPGAGMSRGTIPHYATAAKHRVHIPGHQPGPAPGFHPPGPGAGGIPPPPRVPVPMRPVHMQPAGTSGMRPGMAGPPAGMGSAPPDVITVVPPKEKKKTAKPGGGMRSFFAGRPIPPKK